MDPKSPLLFGSSPPEVIGGAVFVSLVAIVLLATGFSAVRKAKAEKNKAGELDAIPVRPAASCEAGDYVKVEGIVVTGNSAVVAPFSARTVAWVRALVFEHTDGIANRRLDSYRMTPEILWLNDDSGRLVCVNMNRARALVERRFIKSIGPLDHPSPALEAAIESIGTEIKTNGIRRWLDCEEDVILPGQKVYAVGIARLGEAADQPSPVLFLDPNDNDASGHWVGTMSGRQLNSRADGKEHEGIAMIVVSSLVLLVCLGLIIWAATR